MSTLLLRPGKARARSSRVEVGLIVESKTLGTDATYRMNTVDVSKSGMLLLWERKVKMPFIVNTLLEMTIDPSSDRLTEPVGCLGKVIRRVDDDEVKSTELSYIGVQIVQMDGQDIDAWEGCLDELKEKYGFKTSAIDKATREEDVEKAS